ncbi:MAG: PAS domain S-box protein, partial [Oculatellaceae cyanobacterium Prado106]|nr:PAS domain S-box protein [Oculatellaceae cyanobacterium Prado106]
MNPTIAQLQHQIQELESQLADRQAQIDRLTVSEAKFRAIAEHASDTICMINPSGWVTYASPNVEEAIGYSAAEVEGHAFGALIHPEDLPHCRQVLQQVAETGQPCAGLEYRVLHRQGHYIWHRASLSAYQNAAGELMLIAIGRDITDRQLAEAELRESKTQLNRILDNTAALIANYRVYGDRRFIPDYFSSGSLPLWGFTPEAVLENPQLYQSRIEPEDFQRFLAEEYDYIFNEQPYTTEYRYHHPDGNLRWIQFSLKSYRDEQEDCWRCTTLSIDITDRKRAEAALAKSEAKFRTMVEDARELIVKVTTEGILSYISPNVVHLLGYTPAEMEGQHLELLVHPDDLAGCVKLVQSVAAGHLQDVGFESRMRHKNGSYRWYTSNLSRSKDEDGNPMLLSVARDITERKLAEDALRTSEARLNRILDRTLACIADYRVYRDRQFIAEYFSSGSYQLWG